MAHHGAAMVNLIPGRLRIIIRAMIDSKGARESSERIPMDQRVSSGAVRPLPIEARPHQGQGAAAGWAAGPMKRRDAPAL